MEKSPEQTWFGLRVADSYGGDIAKQYGKWLLYEVWFRKQQLGSGYTTKINRIDHIKAVLDRLFKKTSKDYKIIKKNENDLVKVHHLKKKWKWEETWREELSRKFLRLR